MSVPVPQATLQAVQDGVNARADYDAAKTAKAAAIDALIKATSADDAATTQLEAAMNKLAACRRQMRALGFAWLDPDSMNAPAAQGINAGPGAPQLNGKPTGK